jgi:hypothetical protein
MSTAMSTRAQTTTARRDDECPMTCVNATSRVGEVQDRMRREARESGRRPSRAAPERRAR